MTADQTATSVVDFAAQTGRLDFLTAVLAVLALLIGLSAVPVFFYLKMRAEAVAREEAAKALEGAAERVEAAAISKLEAMLPTLVREYTELARNAATEEEANDIALAQDDGTANDDRH